jgi:hypothetical protein
MSKIHEIRREEKCLDYAGGQSGVHQVARIRSMLCHAMQGNQMWSYEDDMIRHTSGYCIELSPTDDKDIYMGTCESSNKYQKWFWKQRINNSTTIQL